MSALSASPASSPKLGMKRKRSSASKVVVVVAPALQAPRGASPPSPSPSGTTANEVLRRFIASEDVSVHAMSPTLHSLDHGESPEHDVAAFPTLFNACAVWSSINASAPWRVAKTGSAAAPAAAVLLETGDGVIDAFVAAACFASARPLVVVVPQERRRRQSGVLYALVRPLTAMGTTAAKAIATHRISVSSSAASSASAASASEAVDALDKLIVAGPGAAEQPQPRPRTLARLARRVAAVAVLTAWLLLATFVFAIAGTLRRRVSRPTERVRSWLSRLGFATPTTTSTPRSPAASRPARPQWMLSHAAASATVLVLLSTPSPSSVSFS